MQKVTWSTGARTYLVTPEQKKALDAERDALGLALDERRESLRDDCRYNGTHIGNPPDPYRDLAEGYLERVRLILGPKPEVSGQ